MIHVSDCLVNQESAVRYVQLIAEGVPPVIVLTQTSKRLCEAATEELLCHIQALEFVHGHHLLRSLGAGLLERLVLLFDP